MTRRRMLSSFGLVLGLCVLVGSGLARSAGTVEAGNAAVQAATAKPTPGEQKARAAPPRERERIIEGTKAGDVVDGGEGDDWMFGYEGHDVLRGGAGRDTLDGGPGDDSLTGGAGHDVIDGGPGRDTLIGGDDNDFIDGGDDDDSLDGGAGTDDIDGGDGDDILTGGAGDDVLAGGDGNDSQSGGEGSDRILGQDGDDRLSGGPGDDRIDGGDGRDSLNGDNGNDDIRAGDGDDIATGGPGIDVIDGGSGADVLIGDIGNDTLLGSGGTDTVDGGEEHDTLVGGDGVDVLTGGPGDDVLIGGGGADVVRADSERDVIVIRAGDVGGGETEWLDGGTGDDTLILNGAFKAAAGETIVDPLTNGTYRVSAIERLQHAHFFTSVGSTESTPALLSLVNPASTVSQAQVVFFSSEGTPLAQAVGGGAAQPTHTVTVPPLGRISIQASGPAQKQRGAALVLADRPLGGFVQTALPDMGALRAGEASLLDSFMIPVRQSSTDGIDTGVAIVASTVRSSVKLTLHLGTGQEVSTPNQGGAEIAIPANGHRVLFVSELFAWAGAEFEGTLTVEGGIDRSQEGGPIAGTGLRRDVKSGAVTPFPVVPIAPVARSGPLYFPTFPVGGNYRSSIVVMNPSPVNRARGTVLFFDSSGQSHSVAVNGQNAATSVAWEIPPLGSAVFAASGAGALRPGSARVVTKEGVAGGIVQVSPPSGAWSAGAADILDGFIAPAARSRASNVTSEIVLGSTAGPVSVTLVLHDGAGNEVAGGRARLDLAANAAVVHPIEVLFPKADTTELQGTLVVRAEGGMVAALVTQVSDGGRVRTVAPLVALP